MSQSRVFAMTRFLLSTVASAFLLAAPVAAIAQTPAAPAAPAKPAAKPAPMAAAKPAAKPATKMAAAKPKPMVHKAAMKPGPTKAGDAAVEKLNEQSLAKAKAGT
jgi:hypothetical protein